MSALALLSREATACGPLDARRTALVEGAARELDSLATRAEVAAQRRYHAAVPCHSRPINGRETRVERHFIDSIRREEYARRRPQAVRALRRLGRELRISAPVDAVFALPGGGA